MEVAGITRKGFVGAGMTRTGFRGKIRGLGKGSDIFEEDIKGMDI